MIKVHNNGITTPRLRPVQWHGLGYSTQHLAPSISAPWKQKLILATTHVKTQRLRDTSLLSLWIAHARTFKIFCWQTDGSACKWREHAVLRKGPDGLSAHARSARRQGSVLRSLSCLGHTLARRRHWSHCGPMASLVAPPRHWLPTWRCRTGKSGGENYSRNRLR